MSPILNVPNLTISVDGHALEATRYLTGVRIHRRANRPAQCVLIWRANSHAELPTLEIGQTLELAGEESEALFSGTVAAVERGCNSDRSRSLSIRAYDALQQLRVQGESRQFAMQSVAAVLGELTGTAPQAHADSPKLEQLFQIGESDFDFLNACCRRTGLFFARAGETVQLFDANGYGQALSLRVDQNLRSWTERASTERAVAGVVIAGWNTETAEPVPGKGAASCDGGTLNLTNLSFHSSAEADAFANGVCARRKLDAQVLSGIADGDPKLQPGRIITVQDPQADVSRKGVLMNVVHRIDPESGYTCEFDTACPQPAAAKAGCSFTLSEVTHVDDPEKSGRVRVKLSSVSDLETGWLPVVLPGVGVDKGLVALPDVGDVVLLLLNNEDPTHALVLGPVFGVKGAPESAGVSGGNTKQFHFLTPGGHKVSLDDAGTKLSVAHSGGSMLEFSSAGTELKSQGKLTISASGNTIELKAAKIEMNQG